MLSNIELTNEEKTSLTLLLEFLVPRIKRKQVIHAVFTETFPNESQCLQNVLTKLKEQNAE